MCVCVLVCLQCSRMFLCAFPFSLSVVNMCMYFMSKQLYALQLSVMWMYTCSVWKDVKYLA